MRDGKKWPLTGVEIRLLRHSRDHVKDCENCMVKQTKSEASQAFWLVDDVEREVADLSAFLQRTYGVASSLGS